MTREQFKQMIYDASKKDTSSPKDCIHLLSLHRFINQIFDDHEVQLKAKDKRIKELEEAMKPKTCEGCKFRNTVKFVQVESETLECCSVCVRNCYDYYEPKDNQ